MMEAEPKDTIDGMETKTEGKQDIYPDQQRLILDGKQLEDGPAFPDHNTQIEPTLQLALRLREGISIHV